MPTAKRNLRDINKELGVISFLVERPTLLIAGIIIAGTGFQLLPIAVVRAGVVLALAAQVFLERRVGSNQFLTSPLFLLGGIALVFYSVILGLFDTYYPGLPFHTIESFYGSDAERLLVVFGLCCLVVHSWIAGAASEPQKTSENWPSGTGTSIFIFLGVALTVSLTNAVNYISPIFGGSEIRSVAAPLLAFCMMYLVYLSIAASGRQKLLIAGVILLTIAGLFYVHEGKKPIFMVAAAILYWLRLKKVSGKMIIILGLISIPVAAGLLQVAQMIRVPNSSVLASSEKSLLSIAIIVLRGKTILRQAETRYCLQSVVNKHWEQPFLASRQLFWLQGLIPRVLWPEKPSLSLGADYSPEYCGSNAKTVHSSSITLLGQPVIQGGGIGLLLHGGILIIALGGVAWLGRKPESLSAVTAVALLPWLIDFDQDFALYVANAVKFFLVMLPLAFIIVRMKARPRESPRHP